MDDERSAPAGTGRELVGLIPAAGRATRLAPLPFSKELVPIGFQTAAEGADRKPKPVSQYLLDRMKLAGATKVFMIARQGKWDIADYFGDGSRLGLRMAYLHVGAPWGPPFTLAQAIPFIGNADVVFGFPDILIDPPDSFTPLCARMHATGADIVLGLFDCRSDEPGDVVEVDSRGRVNALQTKEERPLRPDRYVCWMFAVWNANFTRFLGRECARLERVAADAVHARPEAKAPEWPVGAIVATAIKDGMHVDSVHFKNGRFLDIGTAEGITAAARFPIVWNGIDAMPALPPTKAVPVAFWLLPAAADDAWLAERIAALAGIHGGPRFEPHMTLHIGTVLLANGPADESTDDLDAFLEATLEAFAATTAPIVLEAGQTGQSDSFFKSIFFELVAQGGEPDALSGRQRLLASLLAKARPDATTEAHIDKAVAAYPLRPHLSLFYGDLSLALRQRLASEETYIGRVMRFDRIAAVRPADGCTDLGAVDRWHVFGQRRLRG